jgi:beta-N-acetylhexosaminidase
MDLREKPFYLTEEEEQWVEETLCGMGVSEKAGQLFCVMGNAFPGEALDRLVSEYHVGGILFRPLPAAQILENYQRLDALAKIPLLKAANLEEGGNGAITDGTYYAAPMTTSAAGDPKYARELAQVCANEGRSVGINWSFSPVTDIVCNYQNPITHIRSFGSDPDQVLEYSLEYVKALQAGGVAACAKHFPGDGVDFRDHHLHPTCNSLSAQEWYDSFGRNYQALIDAGLMSFMVGHIMQPAVQMDLNPKLRFEDCLPASLSPELLQGVLRGKFGFNGVITSDATIMRGFNQVMERSRAIPSAIEAGCDMLVFNVDFYEDYEYMLNGIQTGILSEKRLNEAVKRILALKAVARRSASLTRPDPENAAKSRACVDRAVTLVKDLQGIFPLTPEKFTQVVLAIHGSARTGDGQDLVELMERRLTAEGFQVQRFEQNVSAPRKTAGLTPKRLVIHMANYGAVSNNTANRIYWMDPHAQDCPRFLQEQTELFISFAYPFHLQDVPRIKTYINCYSCSGAAVDAVVDKMLGRSAFTGVSPVDAFCGLPDTRM